MRGKLSNNYIKSIQKSCLEDIGAVSNILYINNRNKNINSEEMFTFEKEKSHQLQSYKIDI